MDGPNTLVDYFFLTNGSASKETSAFELWKSVNSLYNKFVWVCVCGGVYIPAMLQWLPFILSNVKFKMKIFILLKLSLSSYQKTYKDVTETKFAFCWIIAAKQAFTWDLWWNINQ